MYLALPSIMALFLSQAPEIVSFSLVGQSYDNYTVNAIGLGNIILPLLPFTMMWGFNGALDTLLS